jgi:hypothetical protein
MVELNNYGCVNDVLLAIILNRIRSLRQRRTWISMLGSTLIQKTVTLLEFNPLTLGISGSGAPLPVSSSSSTHLSCAA